MTSDAVLLSVFSPDHFIDYARVGLNDLHHLGGDVFLDIIGHGNAEIPAVIHSHRRVNSLQKSLLVDSRQNEARLVESLGTLC